jgi:hypothetical protein
MMKKIRYTGDQAPACVWPLPRLELRKNLQKETIQHAAAGLTSGCCFFWQRISPNSILAETSPE